jgi:hypothetical protein
MLRSACIGLESRAILLVNSGSCDQGQFQAGEMAGSSSVEGVAVPEGVQADQVERNGGVTWSRWVLARPR